MKCTVTAYLPSSSPWPAKRKSLRSSALLTPAPLLEKDLVTALLTPAPLLEKDLVTPRAARVERGRFWSIGGDGGVTEMMSKRE